MVRFLFSNAGDDHLTQFFPKDNPTAALLAPPGHLLLPVYRFVPFGALVFGRLGDLIGRKIHVLLTLTC